MNPYDDILYLLWNEKTLAWEPRIKDDSELTLSGVFNVRTSPQVHGLLSKQAKEQGISLNLHVNQILATASSLKEVEKYFAETCNRIEDKIDKHHCLVTSQIDYQKDTIEQYLKRPRIMEKDIEEYAYSLAA